MNKTLQTPGQSTVHLSTYLLYVHKLWFVTKRMRLWILEVEISILLRMAGLSLRNWVRSSGHPGRAQSEVAATLY